MEDIRLTYLGDILKLDSNLIPDFDKDCLTRDFVNTKRFSPVVYDKDEKQPDRDSPNYELWWHEQYRRCIKGYIVPKATKRGHDIWIPGRMYFYLNFWIIFAKLDNADRKEKRNPKFLSLDYFKFMVLEMMFYYKKDNMFPKSRQTGFSEYGAANIGYNFIFLPSSVSVVVAGQGDYAEKTMQNVITGLNNLGDSEFYKRRKPDRSEYIKSSYTETWEDEVTGEKRVLYKGFGSEVYCITAKDNTQAVSRLSPFFVLYEEIGKWKQGTLKETSEFVKPSLRAEGVKTGYQLFIGCVCKGTKVYDKNGNRINIEDLKKEDGIIGFTTEGIYKDTIEHLNPPQKKQCFRIKTKKGGFIECSHDHPLLITNFTTHYTERKYEEGKRKNIKRTKRAIWVETEKLKLGDQIIMPGKINIFGNEKMFDPYLVGLLIGDGSYGFDKTPVLSNCDNEITNYVKSKYDCTVEKSYITKDSKLYEDIRIKGICKKLRELSIYGQTKHKKRLPINLHTYNKLDLMKMISGLYDTDGGVYEMKGLRNGFVINITQLSKELIYELKSLLLRFGINSNVSKINNKNRNREYNGSIIKDSSEYYTLQIAMAADLHKFAMTFKLKVSYKQEMLERIKKEVVPKKINVLVINSEKGKKGIKSDLGEIHYDSIVSIEDIGEQYVYNLTTRDSHTYLANDFVTHNTGGDMDESVADVQEMAYNPKNFDLLEFDNRWEEQEISNTGKVAAFIPSYEFEIIDEDGNAMIEESKISILKSIESKKSKEQYRATTQRPFFLSQMFMVGSGGFLGEVATARLNDRKRWLLTHPEENITFKADIEWIDAFDWQKGVNLIPNEDGKFFIQQPPEYDGFGKVWRNLYNSATDSYDKDESNSSFSMGSCTIWKNALDSKHTFDHWVARVTERPSEDEGGSYMFYEDTVKLCFLYGECENLIEYSNVLIFDYYKRKGVEYLLQVRPQMVISQFVQDGKASQRYGIEPSFIPHALNIWRDTVKRDDYAVVDKMNDIPMIEAFAKFRKAKNYNCDISISCALNTTSAIERENETAYSEGEEEEEDFGGYQLDKSGNISYSESY